MRDDRREYRAGNIKRESTRDCPASKTGIDASSETIRGEDSAALAILTAEYYDRFHPATPEQRTLADTLISSDWLLRLNRAQLCQPAGEPA